MLIGLNSNIKYSGKIYHVQTEDSGDKYMHAISHLFIDGTILATEKTDYQDLMALPEEEREKLIKERMQKQHRVMVRKLTLGGYDALAGVESTKKRRKRKKVKKAGRLAEAAPPAVAAPPGEAVPEPEGAQESDTETTEVVTPKTAVEKEPEKESIQFVPLQEEPDEQSESEQELEEIQEIEPEPLELLPEDSLSEDELSNLKPVELTVDDVVVDDDSQVPVDLVVEADSDAADLVEDTDDDDADSVLELVAEEDLDVELVEPDDLPTPEEVAMLFVAMEVEEAHPHVNVKQRLMELLPSNMG